MTLPLEDNFEDIIAKAQKGLNISDADLAFRAGVSVGTLTDLKSGVLLEGALRLVAPLLGIHADTTIELAGKKWQPAAVELNGLLQFNTQWEDMTVNNYVVFDPASKKAAVFDTGADAGPCIAAIAERGLSVQHIFITHTHVDHVEALPALRAAYPQAPVYVGRGELLPETNPVDEDMGFMLGALSITAKETSGHATHGMTYVIEGLKQQVAVVGDAVFAASMGGPRTSWATALGHNRRKIFTLAGDTVLAPGHGPLTTVAEEKAHNPFYPEFKPSNNPAMQQKLAFVGTGRMGANMARRVKDVGYQVTAVYDVNREAAKDLAAEIGATA